MAERLFFSVVVPAHNEERYLGETLACLAALDYPKDRYEVLVVENGSTDATLAVARSHESAVIRALSYPCRGVSAARNRGVEAASKRGDWVLFLDADTLAAPSLLDELDRLIRGRHPDAAVGLFRVLPRSRRLLHRVLFAWGNAGRAVMHSWPYTAFAIRRDIFAAGVRSDEQRQVAEDVALVHAAQRHGPTFYMWTRSVSTSTRRFDQVGWLRMIALWIRIMPLSDRAQRRFSYDVLR